jgi:multidrug efflux system membrane fusion protein
MRSVTTGVTSKDSTAITAGLVVGERVVTDGLDRLKDGSKVQVVVPANGPTSDAAGASHRGNGGKPESGYKRKQDQ